VSSAASPDGLLRRWRQARRERLAPEVVRSWARTDSLPRGSDAGFTFQNVGPLVGCPPTLWVYFVGGLDDSCSSALGRGAASSAHDTQRLFEKACDSMLSYTMLTSSAGCLREDPLQAPDEQEEEAEGFRASHVFARYDVVVALDDLTRERVAALAGSESDQSCRLCCLTDFLDVCEEAEQIAQLDRLLGPACTPPAAAEVPTGVGAAPSAEEQAISRARRLTDLPAGGASDVASRAVRALCVAGLERFLIAQFPAHLKDRLHPYLVPEGL